MAWEGLTELRQALRRLPDDLRADALPIVEAAADVSETQARQAYPRRTGKLRLGLKQTVLSAGRFGVSIRLANTAPHAFMFEYGTQARHNALGKNLGAMPAGHVFVPVVERNRRAMYERLKAMLIANGLTVTGP